MNSMLPPVRAIDILVVEDNPADVRLMREAFGHARVMNTIHVATDGVDALDFLHRRGPHHAAPTPDLILLDLNLPRKDGRQVLAEIKADPELMLIPVVILTTSRAEEDIIRSYNLHANAYVTKPVGLAEFLEAVQALENFWLAVVTLPPAQTTVERV